MESEEVNSMRRRALSSRFPPLRPSSPPFIPTPCPGSPEPIPSLLLRVRIDFQLYKQGHEFYPRYSFPYSYSGYDDGFSL